MSEFKVNIDNFIGEHIWRMVKTGYRKQEEIPELLNLLRENRLTSELLEIDTCEELKKVLKFQYEDYQEQSNRLDCKGLSSTKIKQHMHNYLQSKLEKITHFLKSS